MQITGHRTISVYLRYRITNEDDRREALERMQAAMRSAGPGNLTSLADARDAGACAAPAQFPHNFGRRHGRPTSNTLS